MPSKGKAGKLQTKSPAEFFADNKNIAGFDNPGKSRSTTTRELVENSLDACEAAGVLPDIEVTLHEIDKPALDKLVGITTHERLDTTLFEKASKEAKKRSGGGGSSAADGDGDGGKGKQETLYYKVMVRDNGCGMPHETIPDSLGRVLAGARAWSNAPLWQCPSSADAPPQGARSGSGRLDAPG